MPHTEKRGGFSGFFYKKRLLVGGFNPSEKYARQIGSFPQIGMKIKNKWNHHLDYEIQENSKKLKEHTWRIGSHNPT